MSCPCTVCAHAKVEEINGLILSHTSLRTIVSRVPGTTRSALGRHRKHVGGLLVRAVARIASPPPEPAEIAAYENDMLAKSKRVETEKYEIYKEQRTLGDLRGASQTLQGIVDIHRWQYELMPSSETEPAVEVRFLFPPSGLHGETRTTNDPNEDPSGNVAESGQRGAATGRTTDGPTSGIPENAVPAQGNVEPEERQVEEIVAAQAKVRDFSIWKAAGVAPAAKDGTDE